MPRPSCRRARSGAGSAACGSIPRGASANAPWRRAAFWRRYRRPSMSPGAGEPDLRIRGGDRVALTRRRIATVHRAVTRKSGEVDVPAARRSGRSYCQLCTQDTNANQWREQSAREQRNEPHPVRDVGASSTPRRRTIPNQAGAVLRPRGRGVHGAPVVSVRWLRLEDDVERHDVYSRRTRRTCTSTGPTTNASSCSGATRACSSSNPTTPTAAEMLDDELNARVVEGRIVGCV